MTSAMMIRFSAMASGDSTRSRNRVAIVAREASTSVGSSASTENEWNRRSLSRAITAPNSVLLAAVMGIDGRFRDAGLASDLIHRDRAETGGEKRALGGGKHRLGLAAGIVPGKRAPRGVHAGSLCVACIEALAMNRPAY